MGFRLAMAGAVEFSRACLETLLGMNAPLAGVLALSSRCANRHSDYADLAPACRNAGVPVVSVEDINSPLALETLRRWDVDVLLVLGWSQLLGEALLGAARKGAIGSHPSLLPRNRGRHPIIWQILNGETESGLTLFRLDEAADRGPILCQDRFPLNGNENAGTFYAKVIGAAKTLLPEAVRLLESGNPPCRPQDESRATYLRKRDEREGWIEWSRPASEIQTLVRALTRPYPGAKAFLPDRTVTVWDARLVPDGATAAAPGTLIHPASSRCRVATGSGVLEITASDPEPSLLCSGGRFVKNSL